MLTVTHLLLRSATLPVGLSQVPLQRISKVIETRADGNSDGKRVTHHRFFGGTDLNTSLPRISIQKLSVLIILAR